MDLRPPDPNVLWKLVSSYQGIMQTLAGGLVGYFSARATATHSARRAAGGLLRAAFAPEMAEMRLERAKGEAVEQLLSDALSRHAAAVETFRPWVPRRSAAAFDKAWRAYYEVRKGVRFFDYYFEPLDGRTARDIYFERVEAILRFVN